MLCPLLGLSASPAWAQRGGDRGSSSGGAPGGGSDRGGMRGGFGGGMGGSMGGSDRGGMRSGGGGPPGGGFGGGGFGGPPGGFGGGGFGGPPGGGFGGAPGGSSFSPVDMLKRFDRNNNNMIDLDEMEGPARFFIDRMAQNNPRIDTKRPIPLDRLAGEMDRMRQERMGGSSGVPGMPGAPTGPTEPEPLVPGFDKVEEKPLVPGFGIPDENSSVKVEERDLREADDRIKRYDTNKDGVLSKDEMQGGRWSDDPMQFDRNRDGKLTKNELAVRYAKRRLGEQGGQATPGAPGSSSDPRSRMAGFSPWGASRSGDNGAGGWGGARPGGDNGGGWGTREGERPAEKPAVPNSYRSPSTREKANAVKGLPDWFARSDADGDGQVMMSEFSTSWTAEKLAEFTRFDLNGDGIVTGRECLSALKNGSSSPAGPTIIASTSSSSVSSSTSTGASIVSAPGASKDDANREWAVRQVGRYDKNKDGQLTVDEWEAMIVKPPAGTDADGNGIITVDEYVKSRAGK
ncbi:MAG: hypothetical protein IT423_02550 [Pirellulaceae bacterium]|nr:hypothetical protein [Pirellulaceae bacterium]